MGKLQELLDILRTTKQSEQDRIDAEQRKIAAAAAAKAAAEAEAISAAALEDLTALAAQLADLQTRHSAAYTAALDAKAAYMAALGAVGKIESEASPLMDQAFALEKHVIGSPPARIQITSDLSHVRHSEPTAFTSPAQVLAAYRGNDWKSAPIRN